MVRCVVERSRGGSARCTLFTDYAPRACLLTLLLGGPREPCPGPAACWLPAGCTRMIPDRGRPYSVQEYNGLRYSTVSSSIGFCLGSILFHTRPFQRCDLVYVAFAGCSRCVKQWSHFGLDVISHLSNTHIYQITPLERCETKSNLDKIEPDTVRAEGGLRALPQEVMWAGAKREKAPHPVRRCISFGLGS